MSGEFRISRVVAAISSVQLYVHRSLLNLEQSDPALNPNIPDVHVEPAMVPAEEWEWRQNYRVWEANRKVFLFPESYLDPNLRDTKSPMFKSLEDNLLAQRITDDSANQAYHRYLTEFAEVSHLRVVGTYFDAEEGSYYFFARTQQDPPQFYFRKWHRQITWTPWEKIELAIEAPYVSAQVLHGRLYLFWVEGQVRDKTTFSGGSSQFQFYDVKVNLVYSSRGPDGKWLLPAEGAVAAAVTEREPVRQVAGLHRRRAGGDGAVQDVPQGVPEQGRQPASSCATRTRRSSTASSTGRSTCSRTV